MLGCLLALPISAGVLAGAAPPAQAATGTTSQTITFSSTPPTDAVVGGTYDVAATSTSNLTVALSIDSSSSSICALTGTAVSFTAAGTCTIDANQSGNGTYAPAPQLQQLVAVNSSAGTHEVTLVAGTTSSAAINLTSTATDLTGTAASGYTFTQAQDAINASGQNIALGIPLANFDLGLSLPALAIPHATISYDPANFSMAIEGTATLPFGSLPVLVTAVWPDGTSTSPVITVGARLPAGLGLSSLDPAWSGVPGAAFSGGEVLYSALSGTATSFDPSVLPPGAQSFYDPSLCPAGGTTLSLQAGANFCGELAVTAASPLSRAFSALGLSGSAAVGGSLGGLAVLFGDHSMSALNGLSLSASLLPAATGPAWLSGTQLTAGFAVANSVATLQLSGNATITAGSVSDSFSGAISVGTDGSFAASLASTGSVSLPFGLSKLSGPTTSLALNLSLNLSSSPSLAGALLVSYTPTGSNTSVAVQATLAVAGAHSITATLALGSAQPDGSLGPLPASTVLAVAGDLLGIAPPTIPDAASLSVSDASFTFSTAPSPSGTGTDTVVSIGGGVTIGTLNASVLLSVHDDNGVAIPIFGIQVGQPGGCTTSCGTPLASLFPGVPIGGLLGSLNLPTIELTAATSSISLPSSSLTSEEANFFTAVDGTLPETITVPGGLSLLAKVPTNLFGNQVAALFGYNGDQTVVLSGTLGADLNLSTLGTSGVQLTGLDLSAVLPATTSQPELLSGLVTDIGQTTMTVSYASGTLTASLDTAATLSIAGSSLKTTLTATATTTANGGSVSLLATIPSWQHPLGISWIKSADASLALTANFPASGSPTFDAKVTAGTVLLASDGTKLPLSLSATLDVSNTASLTVTAAFDGTASLAEIASLAPELAGVSGSISSNPVLDAVGVGPADFTVVVSANPSIALSAQASLTLPGSSAPIKAAILAEASTSTYTLGIKLQDMSLADFLPPNTLTGASELSLPNAAIVLSNQQNAVAAQDLSPDEYNFFKTLYGCPADGTLQSCTDFTSLSISGITFIASMDMPLIVSEEAAKLGIALPAPGTGAVFTVQGTLPFFGGASSVLSLTASLSHIGLPNAPSWFPTGSVQLSISTTGVSITGQMTLLVPRLLAPAGSQCSGGGTTSVDWPAPIGSMCTDALSFAAKLAVVFPTDGSPSIEVSGIFNHLNDTRADTTTYWYPFGLQGVGVHRLALSVSVSITDGEPTVGLGFQGDIKIGSIDVAGAINVGLTVIEAPPFVLPNLLGISVSSASGLSLGDLAQFANELTGSNITSTQLSSVPNVGLQNLNIAFAQETDSALCLQAGFYFSADLYVNGTLGVPTAPTVPSYSDPNGCRKLNQPSGPSSDCVANAGNGCLASIFGSVSPTTGLEAQGEVSAFNLGPISFGNSKVDLTLSPTTQQLTLLGSATVTAAGSPPTVIASGFANLSFSPLDGLTFKSNATLLNGTVRAFVEANAPGLATALTSPNFDFKIWLSSDISSAINGAIASTLSKVKPLIVDISNIVNTMNTNGGIVQISAFQQFADDVAAALNVPVSPVVSTLISDASAVQNAIQKAGLQPNLDWILQGITTPSIQVPAIEIIPPLPGTPGIYTPPGCHFGFELIGYSNCGFLGGYVPPPGLCAFVFVNGTCYGIPPTPAVYTPAFTIPGIHIPGVCQDLQAIGLLSASANCTWSGLLSDLVLQPALDAVNTITGLQLSASNTSGTIDQLINYFNNPSSALFDLSCAEFSVSGSDLALLGSGSVNLQLAYDATLLGKPLNGGLSWSFGNLTDASTLVTQLFNELFNPSPVTCPAEPSTALTASTTVAPPPTETLNGSLSASSVPEQSPVTFNATFGTAQATYPAVTVNWGDGTSSTIAAGSSQTISATHSYSGAGFTGASSTSFQVTATVEDTGKATIQLPIQVTSVPPTITSVQLGSSSVTEGSAAQLTGSFTDPNNEPMTVTIDWGDGTVPDIQQLSAGTLDFSASHRYLDEPASAPSYPVTVSVADQHQETATKTVTETVTEATPSAISLVPQPLVQGTSGAQCASGPTTVVEGVTSCYQVSFADAAPSDPHNVTIDWGDGTPATTVSLSSATLSTDVFHAYQDEGSFQPTVTVTDGDGATAAPSADPVAASANRVFPVSVADVPLTAGAPQTIVPTEAAAFSGTVGSFLDANPNATTADFAATITWGDGSTSPGTVTGPTGGPFLVSGTHTYAEEGVVPTSIDVVDDGGSTVTVGGYADVADAALSAGAPITITPVEGNVFQGKVATFTDANPTATTAADFTATITWGDGKTSAGTVVADSTPGSFSVSGTHTYAEEGVVPTSIDVVDDGGSTVTVAGSADVADAALSAGAPITITPVEGNVFQGKVATFTDANPGGTVSDFTATITWGDGKTSAGTVVADSTPGSFSVSGTHTYAEEGSYVTSVALHDVGGAKATLPGSARITVITHTVLSSALTPSAVDFTATVAPSDATGTVTFFSSFDGQSPAPISGCADLSLTATAKDVAAVTCPVLALPPGDNEVSASYSGDTPTGYFLPSATAMTTAQTVQALCASPPSPVGLSGDGFGDRPSSTTGGVIEGTIDGGLDLRGNVYFLGRVVVNGDVNLDGGSLTMSCGSIAGDLNSRGASIVLSGGPIGIGQDLRTSEGSGLLVYGATVGGSVQVQDTSPAPFALCGTTVGGLQLLDSTFNAAPTIGGASGTICGPDAVTGDVAIRGNTLNGLDLTNLPIGGGVQVEHNQVTTGSIALSGGTVQRDAQVSDNTVTSGSITMNGASIAGGLQLQRNNAAGSISLSGGTVQRDAQVSDNTSAGSITLDGLSTSGDLQVEHNQVTTGSIALSGGTVQRDAQVSDNTVTSGSITMNGASIAGGLQLQRNNAAGSISLSGGTVQRDAQVSDNTSAGSITLDGLSTSGDLQVQHNSAGDAITVSFCTIGGDLQVDQNRASTGAISVVDCTVARDGDVHGNVAPLGVVVQSDTFGGHVHVFANGTGSDSGGGSGGSGGGNGNGGHSAHARRGRSDRSRESRGNRRH